MTLWTPMTLGATVVQAWWAADAITGGSDGVGLATWQDRSGNSRDATQGTAGDRPIYRTNRQNSLPGVEFVSTDALTSALSASNQDEFIIAVVKPTDFTGQRTILGASGSPSSGGRQFRLDQTTGKLTLNREAVANIATSTGVVSAATVTLVEAGLGAATWRFAINGGTPETGAHAQTLTAARTSILGRSGDVAAEDWLGDLYEIVVGMWSSLSSADIARLQGYLAWRWGISASLPGGHAYKNAAPTTAGHSGLRYRLCLCPRQRALGSRHN